jgi:hypothetical protein
MRTYLIIKRIVVVVSLILISSIPAFAEQAVDQTSGRSVIQAVGAVEDTLKACLTRIPKDGSAGQRLLAEQNCQGDQRNREMILVAPQF